MRYFRTGARSRRFLFICAATAVVVLAGTAAIAYAAYPSNSVQTMTGCLTTSGTGSGNLVNVSMGANPAKACGSNQTLVHLSGGTITQVTAGTGLSTAGSGGTGGSGFINNGFVTLGLLPGFSLPQNCTSGQVAKSSGSNSWACANDQNTTYSNGTGLDLNGSNVFSVDPAYQLPQTGCASGQFVASDGSGGWNCQNQTTYDGSNFATSGQDCPAHQFATGIDSNGKLKCAQPGLDDLSGSPCTFNGHPSTLKVSTDNTTGDVTLNCQPVYEVSGTVSGGSMTLVLIQDYSNDGGNSCSSATSCSLLVSPGDQVSVNFESGDDMTGGGTSFTYMCPGDGTTHTAMPIGTPQGGFQYDGTCPLAGITTVNADYAATASFSGS